MRRLLRRWRRDEGGSILVESILVFTAVTVLTVGLVEFGSLLWQRSQMHIGVRDAARYISRCPLPTQPTLPTENSTPWCNQTIARNIALRGTLDDTGPLRVPNWTENGGVEFQVENGVVAVTGTFTYTGSPLFGALRIRPITMEYTHQQRLIGW